jgi:hypothetical protein
MNYIDLLVFLAFLANFGVVVAKLWNISALGKLYGNKVHILTGWAVSGIAWLILLGNNLTDPTNANNFFFMLSNWVFQANSFLSVVEILTALGANIIAYSKGEKGS